MIRAVVFDFDGTLVLSNAIKEESFYDVAEAFPGGREQMKAILRDTPGDRSAIWRRFASHFHIAAQVTDLIDRYTALCQTRIETSPERAGASAVLAMLRDRGMRLYVNSSTPTEPLLAVTAARFGPGTFDDVRGGYGRKVENLQRIAGDAGLEPRAIVMVGDGVDDWGAARECGCHFIGVSGGSLAFTYPGSLLDDLRDLPALLPSMKEPVT